MGVPFFISCLKDSADNLSSGFSYITASDILEFVPVKHKTGDKVRVAVWALRVRNQQPSLLYVVVLEFGFNGSDL